MASKKTNNRRRNSRKGGTHKRRRGRPPARGGRPGGGNPLYGAPKSFTFHIQVQTSIASAIKQVNVIPVLANSAEAVVQADFYEFYRIKLVHGKFLPAKNFGQSDTPLAQVFRVPVINATQPAATRAAYLAYGNRLQYSQYDKPISFSFKPMMRVVQTDQDSVLQQCPLIPTTQLTAYCHGLSFLFTRLGTTAVNYYIQGIITLQIDFFTYNGNDQQMHAKRVNRLVQTSQSFTQRTGLTILGAPQPPIRLSPPLLTRRSSSPVYFTPSQMRDRQEQMEQRTTTKTKSTIRKMSKAQLVIWALKNGIQVDPGQNLFKRAIMCLFGIKPVQVYPSKSLTLLIEKDDDQADSDQPA